MLQAVAGGLGFARAALVVAVAAAAVQAAEKTFENDVHVATFRSAGLYDLVGLGTWNGQPLSDTNRPNDQQRYLAATIELYVDGAAPNVLYVRTTDVVTTLGAWWFGGAFVSVTQTGVRFSLPTRDGAWARRHWRPMLTAIERRTISPRELQRPNPARAPRPQVRMAYDLILLALAGTFGLLGAQASAQRGPRDPPATWLRFAIDFVDDRAKSRSRTASTMAAQARSASSART